jgi:hypothetical protein
MRLLWPFPRLRLLALSSLALEDRTRETESLDMVQRYTHLSQQSVRRAYDSVFSKPKTAELEICAQKPSNQSEEAKKVDTLEDRLCAAFLDGKISEGMLEKLLTMRDGQQARENAVSVSGYA